MPKDTVYVRRVWERKKGSGVWWIRYRAEGVLKREKVGTKKNAIDLLRKRKNDIRVGITMPENMRQTSVRFKTLSDDILVYSKKHHRDFRCVEIRVKRLSQSSGRSRRTRSSPQRLDEWLSKALPMCSRELLNGITPW